MTPRVESIPWVIALLVPALVVAIAWHELGHAVSARLVGLRVFACGVGLMRPWIHRSICGISFYFGRPFTSGLTIAVFPTLRRRPGAEFATIFGGPFASLLGLILGIAAWSTWPHDALASWILASTYCFLTTILPFSWTHGQLRLHSDGLQLVNIAFNRRIAYKTPSAASLGTMLAVADMLERIDQPAGAAYFRLMSATLQLEFGDNLAAERGLATARQIADSSIAETEIYDPIVEGSLLVSQKSSLAASYLAEQLAIARDPMLIFNLRMLELQRQRQAGLPIAAQLPALREAAIETRQPFALYGFDLFAFEVDPPADAAQACRQLIRRHRAVMLDTRVAWLLAITAETLAQRGEDLQARQFFVEAKQAIERTASFMVDQASRQAYLQAAALPLQRALLENTNDVPLYLELSARPIPGHAFGRMAIIFSAMTFMITLGSTLARGFVADTEIINVALVSIVWIVSLWLLVVLAAVGSAARRETPGAQRTVATVVATLSLMVGLALCLPPLLRDSDSPGTYEVDHDEFATEFEE